MKQIFATFVGLLLLVASVSAKGSTTRVTISGGNLTAQIQITDSNILKPFQVWAGPGTFTNRVEQTEGFLIDWLLGVVADRPSGLQRYVLSFYATDDRFGSQTGPEELAYVVLYELDPATNRGFVFLPGRGDEWYQLNTTGLFRGREGNWFRATRDWDSVAGPLIDRQ